MCIVNSKMLSIVFSFIAILVSIGTAILLYRNRVETNRPIVTVLLESDSGNIATPLTIRIYNTGNTPALDITLDAYKKDIDKALVDSVLEVHKKMIFKSLSKENIIPVIHNNSSVHNSFGLISNNEDNVFHLNSKIPIIIKYKDIQGRSYHQSQTLIIKITDNFAGSCWTEKEEV